MGIDRYQFIEKQIIKELILKKLIYQILNL